MNQNNSATWWPNPQDATHWFVSLCIYVYVFSESLVSLFVSRFHHLPGRMRGIHTDWAGEQKTWTMWLCPPAPSTLGRYSPTREEPEEGIEVGSFLVQSKMFIKLMIGIYNLRLNCVWVRMSCYNKCLYQTSIGQDHFYHSQFPQTVSEWLSLLVSLFLQAPLFAHKWFQCFLSVRPEAILYKRFLYSSHVFSALFHLWGVTFDSFLSGVVVVFSHSSPCHDHGDHSRWPFAPWLCHTSSSSSFPSQCALLLERCLHMSLTNTPSCGITRSQYCTSFMWCQNKLSTYSTYLCIVFY